MRSLGLPAPVDNAEGPVDIEGLQLSAPVDNGGGPVDTRGLRLPGPIRGVEPKREVRGQHDRRLALLRVVGVLYEVGPLAIHGNPLDRAAGAAGLDHSKRWLSSHAGSA